VKDIEMAYVSLIGLNAILSTVVILTARSW